MISHQQIEQWCHENLFGQRSVEGVEIELTIAQASIKSMIVEVIEKWEARDKKATNTEDSGA